jgi:hypothetical protein
MDRDQDPGGDYGYDMVHEDMAREDRAREAATGIPHREEPAAPQRREPSPAASAPELGTDLAYDESHDF